MFFKKKAFFAGIFLVLTMTVVLVVFPGISSMVTARIQVDIETISGSQITVKESKDSVVYQKGNNRKQPAKIVRKKLSMLCPKSTKNDSKLVLIYTPLYGSTPWPDMKNTHDLTHFKGKPCKVTNCRLTYDKKDLTRSDAVIFHGRDMLTLNAMKEISRNRNQCQRWVFFSRDDPYYIWLGTELYNNFFNWTMTYRRDSDIFAPGGSYSPLDSTEKASKTTQKNYAQGKDKFIAWIVDRCGKPRDYITTKLLKYVDVTVFGDGAQKFGQTGGCGGPECDKLLRRFKFYLSFESANCIDFVSGKYWDIPIQHDMVPIVLGPLKYDSKIAIPGSYINVMDFPSLEDLANYLKYLDKNDTAYNEYFQWKLKYKIEKEYPWNCQMCEDLNNPNLPVKVYDDLGTYWGIESSCGEYEEKVKTFS